MRGFAKFGASLKAGRQRGFTLLELMIVVAIVGILVSIAVPAYQEGVDYNTHSSLGLSASSRYRSKYVPHVSVKGGSAATVVVQVSMTNDRTLRRAGGEALVYSPVNRGANNLQWITKPAASSGVPTKYLPKNWISRRKQLGIGH